MALITLIVDASCDSKGNSGFSYACYSFRGTDIGGAKLKSYVKNSYEAGAMSVVNALHKNLKQGLISPGDTVLVKTCSMDARILLTAKQPPTDKSKAIYKVYNVYKQLEQSFRLKVLFKRINSKDKCYGKARSDSRYYRLYG